MKMPFGPQRELSVSEEAAQWLCALQDANREQRAEFFLWLRRSPRHVEEFLFATALWKKLEHFGLSDPARIERLIASAQINQQEAGKIVALPAQDEPHTRRPRRWGIAVAASALIFFSALAVWVLPTQSPKYSTAIGEQRVINLADGSRVDLNTRSRIAVRFSANARDVRLLEGEALFTVAKDPARPFRVDTGNAVIQAVGTQFNVYRHSSGTKVSVLEGAVRIAEGPTTLKLVAGEAAQIKSDGQLIRHRPESVADAVLWREHRLVFRGSTLEDVVAEVSRYTTQPIRVEGEARKIKLTAIFDSDDPDSLIRFLRQMDNLSVETQDGETLIRSP